MSVSAWQVMLVHTQKEEPKTVCRLPFAISDFLLCSYYPASCARGVHCGRTASYPTAPAQIPACGTIAPGFSEVFASAKALSQTRGDAHDCAFGTTYDTWFCNAKPFHQLIETKPIVTLALAALIEVFPQRPDGMKKERIEAGQVAINPEVVIVPTQFCVQRLEQFW